MDLANKLGATAAHWVSPQVAGFRTQAPQHVVDLRTKKRNWCTHTHALLKKLCLHATPTPQAASPLILHAISQVEKRLYFQSHGCHLNTA